MTPPSYTSDGPLIREDGKPVAEVPQTVPNALETAARLAAKLNLADRDEVLLDETAAKLAGRNL